MTKTKTGSDEVKITVIVPRDVVEKLDAQAARERRSRSSEAAKILERAVSPTPA
jgi:hypothetical protein